MDGSFYGRTDYFDIVTGVLQDTLAPYLFIICLDYELRMLVHLIKENVFTPKKKKPKKADDIRLIH